MPCSRDIWRRHKARQRANAQFTASVQSFSQSLGTWTVTMNVAVANINRVVNYQYQYAMVA